MHKQTNGYHYYTQFKAMTYWDVINPHTTQCSSVIAEIILYGGICHLKKTFTKEKRIMHVK